VSIRKLGEDAFATAIEYVPAVARPSKSSGCTNGYAELHEPRLAPTVPVKTVAPLAFFTLNVAPAALVDDIRYARFAAAAGYPTWLTRTNAVSTAARAL
jgi:hypothetical protein